MGTKFTTRQVEDRLAICISFKKMEFLLIWFAIFYNFPKDTIDIQMIKSHLTQSRIILWLETQMFARGNGQKYQKDILVSRIREWLEKERGDLDKILDIENRRVATKEDGYNYEES